MGNPENKYVCGGFLRVELTLDGSSHHVSYLKYSSKASVLLFVKSEIL